MNNKNGICRFPAFDCPNPLCGARNVLFAINKKAYNNSKVMVLEDLKSDMCVDYVFACPKCKKRLFIWNRSMIDAPLIRA